ncbi:MAG TPA: PRC-barrel domain-containing protein [Legionella sp.]|nr:PRC-barrel domain-containing protein [Legionella sp.]
MDNAHIVKTSDITGLKVRNLDGITLGTISELVINKLSGKTNYMVVDFDGHGGMKNKYFAFPWGAFEYSETEDCYVLDVDIQLLKNTIGLDNAQWPNFNFMDLEIAARKYYQ